MALPECLAHHFGQVYHPHAAATGDFKLRLRGRFKLNFDLGIVKMTIGKTLTKCRARGFGCALAREHIKQPCHRRIFGLVFNCNPAAFFFKPDGLLNQVTRNLFNIAANIANLGELGRLNLNKRRIGELGQTARNLGLAAAGRANHQDVFGRHFVAQFGRKLLPPPAIAHRHRHRALGLGLADNMFVEGRDDCLWGKPVVHNDFREKPFPFRGGGGVGSVGWNAFFLARRRSPPPLTPPLKGRGRFQALRRSIDHWCKRKFQRRPPSPCARELQHLSHNP